MDAEKRREIAGKGGRAAHAKGRAHEFTPEEAAAASRKRRNLRHKSDTVVDIGPPVTLQPSEPQRPAEPERKLESQPPRETTP